MVLGLPAPDQFRLLRAAEMNRFTRRHLQKVATEIRSRRKAPGAAPAPRVLERFAGLEMLARDAGLDQQLNLLSEQEARHALDAVFRLREQFAYVERKLYSKLSR